MAKLGIRLSFLIFCMVIVLLYTTHLVTQTVRMGCAWDGVASPGFKHQSLFLGEADAIYQSGMRGWEFKNPISFVIENPEPILNFHTEPKAC